MTIGNEIRNHGYITLQHIFAHEIARENLSFQVLLTVIFFPKNIQSNFTLIMPWNGNSCCELSYRQYQLKFR